MSDVNRSHFAAAATIVVVAGGGGGGVVCRLSHTLKPVNVGLGKINFENSK